MDRKVIRRVVVANRGEIAVRIARTCREMDITSILAHSDDDAASVAALSFDELVSLGRGEARQTYLNVANVIDAAKRAKADALHPGFGFLSERAELAAACVDAGIIFIGPKAESIAAMGSKAESRKLMEQLGVPVVPGYHGDDQSIERLVAEGERVGFPLLVKASAGGGGKGMKVVRESGTLREAIASAQREALKSFGDEKVLLERYIEQPRHIEFQIFGDAHGSVLHLFERDCSVQRRHQKVVEESPAPNYSHELRQKMAAAAIAAAKGVNYENAGTVEFIVTPGGEFYFLEMNTRLQVEHPVTESVLGLDLVRAQLAVAAGEPLPWKQEDLTQRGHAIECRIYAEDPEQGFLPQIGRIARYAEPAGPGIRVDSGVRSGSEVSIHYDPMLAKLIVTAENRAACIDRLVRALGDYVILGTTTNLSYLRRVVNHPIFREGKATTDFLAEQQDALFGKATGEAAAIAALIAKGGVKAKQATSSGGSDAIETVWDKVGSWGRS